MAMLAGSHYVISTKHVCAGSITNLRRAHYGKCEIGGSSGALRIERDGRCVDPVCGGRTRLLNAVRNSTYPTSSGPISLSKEQKKRAGGVFNTALSSTSFSGGGEPAVEDEEVAAVLFDMDGVLCDSEDPSREAAVKLFAEMGVKVSTEDFVPFMGTGEANFLGGVARVYGVKNFDPEVAKKRFFEIYIEQYATPDSGIGYEGALQLVQQCREAGLKVAVASSADRIKVDANLRAAGIPLSNFDAIVSADKFKNLKPAPDIFFAAARELQVPPSQCVVLEDALAGVQAACSAGMRCIAVTTTLTEEKLLAGSPSLVRKDISKISVSDILSLSYPKSTNGDGENRSPESSEPEAARKSTTVGRGGGERESDEVQEEEGTQNSLLGFLDSPIGLPWGGTTSRRSILRFGSLSVAFGAMAFTVDNLQALSYLSPKAILNLVTGTMAPPASAQGGDRISALKKYIADVEKSGSAATVPEFEARLPWLNSAPLTFARELKGKVVLLDFWTYCCINCMHVLPDLAALEKKYKNDPFVVVGVHSAKFDNEKDLGAIRSAVLRYDVQHPVVNDGEMLMWRALGVSSWPTLALVSPQGKLIGMLSGEGNKQIFDDLIAASMDYYGEKGLLDNSPIPVALEKDKDLRLLSTQLKFPGKIATDLANGRIFISDSNNHRIVVTDFGGKFILQIGSGGEEGLQDGPFELAAFNRPQGVAYDSRRDVLYVADTENHALREVDFKSELVRTLAGNGTKGEDYGGGRKGSDQVLNSPWDVELDSSGENVFVAIAGHHQIWIHSITEQTTRNFSGSGYERNQNGRTGKDTAYAQPSGISLSQDGSELFLADSESSSVRAVNLSTGGSRLCAGGDPNFAENLFKFGDRDGGGGQALLQHPLGVLALPDGKNVLVADSYNHKIKILDTATNEVRTIAGNGIPGFHDGAGTKSQFSEPAGFALGPNGSVLVADTNNSVIRVVDVNTRPCQVSTLDLSSVPPPAPPPTAGKRRLRRRQSVEAEVVKFGEVNSAQGTIIVRISIPEGYHYTNGAVSKFEIDVADEGGLYLSPLTGELKTNGLESTAEITYDQTGEGSTAKINCKVYYCQQDDVCLYKVVTFEVPFSPSLLEKPSSSVLLDFKVQPKQASSIASKALSFK